MTATADKQRSLHDASVLVVSSDQSNRQAVVAFLDALGVETEHVSHLDDHAIAKALRSKPDMIIVDVTGDRDRAFSVLKAMTDAKVLKDIPILAACFDDDPKERDRAFAAGAMDVLGIPLRGSEIINRVRAYLERGLYREAAERYQDGVEEGVALSRQLQESLLPTPFGIREIEKSYGIEIDFYFESSSSVGGDLWGFHRLSSSKLAVFCIDFSGHGVPAALNCFRFHTTMSELAPKESDPAAYLSALNKALRPAIRRGQFATMFYGILDFAENQLIYAAAGVPGPVVGNRSDTRSFACLDTAGVPLGITDRAEYRNITVPMGPDSFILLYSDALIEATQVLDGEPLGETGVMGFLAESIDDFSDVPPLDGLIGRFFERIVWSELPDDLTAIWLHLPKQSLQSEAQAEDREMRP